MLDLDDDRDDCQQCLLTIVARGTAIITELYRLVELIPEPFQDKVRQLMTRQEKSRLDEIICNFSYFKHAEEFEAKIESSPELKRLDEKFCDDYIDLLTRFYLTFEAVQRQANDLNQFILNLEDEIYIGQSLDGIMANHESRQLLSEAYFQIGYMLLLIDNSFDGDLRERLIVSYYRYSAYRSSPGTNLDETCNLMRATGYYCNQQKSYGGEKIKNGSHPTVRPLGYPETYLLRIGINQSVVGMLIAKLQDVDIYNQTSAVFPHSDHRSNALSQQAAILYVILYFCPNILKTQRSRMREITDKFFSDNWVVHIFMGEYVNLIEMWEPYRAARESLIQIHESESVKSLTSQINVRFNRNAKQLNEYLKEGWMNEDTFVEHSGRILNCVRDSNVVLKWMLLHSRMHSAWQTNKLTKALSAIVVAGQPDSKKLCEFLQNLCVLEKRIGSLYERVYETRKIKIEENKARACDMLDELVSIFNDTKPMRWVKIGANQGLAKILAEVRDQLSQFGSDSIPGSDCRDLVVRLINRMESARDSYSDGKSLQVVQLFMDTKESLVKLLRYLDLTEDLKIVLQSVSDFSYGWKLVDVVFTDSIQQVIKDDPENMFAFEAVINKLTSAFETQLVRLQQIDAKTDLISVTQYYSSKLVSYIKKVLQIIPATIMELISYIINIQADNKLTNGSMPPKIQLDQLKDYAMPKQRSQMLQSTCKISHYARGIMAMPNTAIGLQRIDSKRMLEDGLRQELSNCVSRCIEDTLNPKTSMSQASSLNDRLVRLDSTLNSYKRSFQYIQDFLSIYGLKMWQEELGSIVRSAVEQGMTSLMSDDRSQTGSNQLYRSDSNVEINSIRSMNTRSILSTNLRSTPANENSKISSTNSGFILRIVNEILELTNPHESIYDEQANVWFDKRRQSQVLDSVKMLRLIWSSLGVAGLNGLDRISSALLMSKLEKLGIILISGQSKPTEPNKSLFENTLLGLFEVLNKVRNHTWLLMDHADEKSLRQLMLKLLIGSLNQRSPFSTNSSASTVATQNKELIDLLLSVGQLQILRCTIQYVLSSNCRYEARHLHGCLDTLNTALLTTIRQGRRSSIQQKARAEDDDHQDAERLDNHTDRRVCSASLDESQLVSELANYLEWIGLSDPMKKIYTLALQKGRLRLLQTSPASDLLNHGACDGIEQRKINSPSSADNHRDAIYRTILDHSKRVRSYLPSNDHQRLSRSYSVEGYLNMVDEQPLYLGMMTLLNHFQANIVV